MLFQGIRKTFSTIGECQYETIGAFWNQLAAVYGIDRLRGLGYGWTDTSIEYIIGLKDGVIEGCDCAVELPDTGWEIARGKTEDLSRIYDEIYSISRLLYEIETFTADGNCEIAYIRAKD